MRDANGTHSWLTLIGITASGRRAYKTTVIDSATTEYTVKKWTLTRADDRERVWAEGSETFTVVVEKESFGSGKTKHTFKVSTG